MNPMQIAALVMQCLPYGIEFAKEIVKLIHAQNPSLADWNAALDKAQIPFRQDINPGAVLPDKPV